MEDLTRSREDTKITKIDFDLLSKTVVDSAFKIHQSLGSGMLEPIYQEAFEIELENRNLTFEKQKHYPVFYGGKQLRTSLRLDLLIEGKIIVELKSEKIISNAAQAQLLTYMRISGVRTGFIINFGEPYFKKAVKRMVL